MLCGGFGYRQDRKMSEANENENMFAKQCRYRFVGSGILGVFVFAAVFAVFGREAFGQQCRFADHWVQMESAGNPRAVNRESTAVGRWQMTQAAFEEVGLLQSGSSRTVNASHFGGQEWTNVQWADNPFGIRSVQDILNNPQAQDHYGRLYFQKQWQTAQRTGMTRHIGSSVAGVGINESSLLTCMGYLGSGGCRNLLDRLGQDPSASLSATERHALTRMARATECDASEFAGQNTQVDVASSIAAAPSPKLFCDPTVMRRLEEMAMRRVEAERQLAMTRAGFSTSSGTSIAQTALWRDADPRDDDEGAMPGIRFATAHPIPTDGLEALFLIHYGANAPDPTDVIFDQANQVWQEAIRFEQVLGRTPGRAFGALQACIGRLLRGPSIVFGIPGLQSILDRIINAACRAVESRLLDMLRPLNVNLYEQVSLYNIPIGTVGGSVRVGGGSPGSVSINHRTINDVFNHGTTGPLFANDVFRGRQPLNIPAPNGAPPRWFQQGNRGDPWQGGLFGGR